MQLSLENFNVSHEIVMGVIVTPAAWVVKLWNEARKKEIEEVQKENSILREEIKALAERTERYQAEMMTKFESRLEKVLDKLDTIAERLTDHIARGACN